MRERGIVEIEGSRGERRENLGGGRGGCFGRGRREE